MTHSQQSNSHQSISQQLENHLNTLSDSPVAIVTKHGVAYLDVNSVDQWSCRLDAIRFKPGPASSNSDWQRLADAIVKRVRYLAAPLAVIESDEEAKTAQVRSSPPRLGAKQVSYFECTANPAQVAIQRYLRKRGGVRACIPFGITRDALAQLLLDLDHSCGQCEPAVKPSLRDRVKAR